MKNEFSYDRIQKEIKTELAARADNGEMNDILKYMERLKSMDSKPDEGLVEMLEGGSSSSSSPSENNVRNTGEYDYRKKI